MYRQRRLDTQIENHAVAPRELEALVSWLVKIGRSDPSSSNTRILALQDDLEAAIDDICAAAWARPLPG